MTVIASVAAFIAAAAPTARYGHAVGRSIHNTRPGRDRPLVARLLAGIAAGHARRPIISLNKNISLARRVRAAAAGRQAGRRSAVRVKCITCRWAARRWGAVRSQQTGRLRLPLPFPPPRPSIHIVPAYARAAITRWGGARAARQGIKINRILSRRYRRRVHAAFH